MMAQFTDTSNQSPGPTEIILYFFETCHYVLAFLGNLAEKYHGQLDLNCLNEDIQNICH